MLSTSDLEEEVALSIEAGAIGYVTKSAGPACIFQAIRNAISGDRQFSEAELERVKEREQLTPRELEVLTGMARGCSNKQIAEELHLSIHTVKTYVKSLLAKLGVDERAGAVAEGFARGILKL